MLFIFYQSKFAPLLNIFRARLFLNEHAKNHFYKIKTGKKFYSTIQE